MPWIPSWALEQWPDEKIRQVARTHHNEHYGSERLVVQSITDEIGLKFAVLHFLDTEGLSPTRLDNVYGYEAKKVALSEAVRSVKVGSRLQPWDGCNRLSPGVAWDKREQAQIVLKVIFETWPDLWMVQVDGQDMNARELEQLPPGPLKDHFKVLKNEE